ncbi:replication initiation protein RepM (plasmid) [Acinetobacter baumannii]
MGNLVVKDNALINASYNLDLVEQRLILLAIIEARESGKGINANDPLTVHAESYINQFSAHRNTAYQALKDACKALFSRYFTYQEPRGKTVANIQSRWVSQIAYIDDQAKVEIIFAPAIIPLITRLEEQFTKYDIEQISDLSSAYAVRLYELLIAWRSTGKTPIIEIKDFRKKLGVLDSEYPRMFDFKKRVLELAINQINEKTDIKVKVEQHKTGRFVTGFSFKFKQKQTAISEKTVSPQRDQNTPDLFTKMTDPQRYLFAYKLSEMPEMSEYSEGTESYEDFAKRIADMLLEPEKFKKFYPLLQKLGFGTKSKEIKNNTVASQEKPKPKKHKFIKFKSYEAKEAVAEKIIEDGRYEKLREYQEPDDCFAYRILEMIENTDTQKIFAEYFEENPPKT